MKVNMKKIESLMILRGVNVTELMQAAGLERATYYYIKKKGGTSPRKEGRHQPPDAQGHCRHAER